MSIPTVADLRLAESMSLPLSSAERARLDAAPPEPTPTTSNTRQLLGLLIDSVSAATRYHSAGRIDRSRELLTSAGEIVNRLLRALPDTTAPATVVDTSFADRPSLEELMLARELGLHLSAEELSWCEMADAEDSGTYR